MINEMTVSDQLDLSQLLTGREHEIKALDELFARSASYRVGKNFLALLQFINRLPRLSPFNAFLIQMQHPGVEYVTTAYHWDRDFNRRPKRDARPLVILVPFGPVSFVYDVSETDGDPIPPEALRPFNTHGQLPKPVYDLTLENCKRDSVPVYESDFGSGKAGYATRRQGDFSISINRNYTLEDRYSTLAHELGHIFSGHVGTTPHTWWPDRSKASHEVKEIEAESISFLVCKRLGLGTTSEEYLASYVERQEEFPPFSLETVLTVSGYIERMGKERLRPRKADETKKR
jgi:hypothetical protein